MKANYLVFVIWVAFFTSCNNNKENKATDISLGQDALAPLQITVLADLPDSLKPKTFALDSMPKPLVNAVQKSGNETIMLPVLENEKGEPILDQEGKPIIMGDGGLSNFTTFTTDNGLASDIILCSIMDKTGNLWFGTEGGGVSRYDGRSFTNFSTAHGLANNSVSCISQDKTGNIWFGTFANGVSRYDGKSFTNFTTDHGLAGIAVLTILADKDGSLWFGTIGGGVSRYDGKSFTNFTTADGLANDNVRSIAEDKDGNLWFGTVGGGVSRYDGKFFTTFTAAQGLANNNVWSITEDKAGNLWFGNNRGGVSRYDGKSFTTFTAAQGLIKNNVWSITEDKIGNIWFGTFDGVSRYDGKSFTTFTAAQGLANINVWSITEDKAGNLWFGTKGGGVIRYEGKSFTNFTAAHGLADNAVSSILEDKDGSLWFGTTGIGVSRYDGRSFTNFTPVQGRGNILVNSITEDKAGNLWFGIGIGVSRYNGNSFTNFTTAQGLTTAQGQINMVRCSIQDMAGNLWFGTDGDGLSRYDGNSFTNFTTAQGLANNSVRGIIEDKDGNLWFGTAGGVSRYDGNSFTNFTTAHGLASNYVVSISEDKDGNLWFGTDQGLSFLALEFYKNLFQEKVGSENSDSHPNPDRQRTKVLDETINKVKSKDKITSTFFRSFGTADGLSDNVVTQVVQLPNSKLAVGTNVGITVFSISEDYSKLTDLEVYNSSTGYPVKNVISGGQNSMVLDSKGILWAGTSSDKTALVRFEYEALNRSVEPPVLVIQSIKVKDEKISWNTLSEPFDRVQGKSLNGKSETSNAMDSLTTPAYITEEVGLFGRELSVAERDSIKHRFDRIEFEGITPFYLLPENLVLPYTLNQISFEFAAIETSRPQLVKYQYFLEGYDQNWRPVTNQSNANFGNINEGTYTFHLKAQGANGIWTEPITYTFRVLPPWWRTSWAYMGYVLMLVSSIFAAYSFQLRQRMQEAESLRIRELDEVKTKLYTNITHEFRTPLTVIMGMAQMVLENPKEHLQSGLKMIIRNGQNLLTLVNQMLDLSKLESNKLDLHFYRADIISFLEYIVSSFHSLAEKKAIQIHFIPISAKLIMDFDEVRIQQIVSNLISNAIKFTQEGGHIDVSVENTKDILILTVKDTGVGIDEADLPYIFDRFYQVDGSHTRHGEGTGIGLAITRELVKLMGGTITVKSIKSKGTEFEVKLPIRIIEGSEELPIEELFLSPKISQEDISVMKEENSFPSNEKSPKDNLSTKESPRVLIADDNEDVLSFIASCLKNNYHIETAKNGQECETKAFNLIPDLIVLDVMMPVKDGIEVCKTLKNNVQTSHIPIIMLTAKADLKSKLEGLEQGADAYLTKPFDKNELLLRIRKLLDLRQQLQQHYRSTLEASISGNSIPDQEIYDSTSNPRISTNANGGSQSIPLANSLDHAFVIKVRKTIEAHMEAPDFDVEKLCRFLALSHSQVHRKLSALTGLTATHFIRYVRLVKAREMIINSGYSISAIAYECGFNDPAYFSRVFKQEFGVSPQVWRDQNVV